MKKQPLVSILMTAYNREKYIAEAIESVIVSSYKNWELIIVDDQSKDNSFKIAKQYEAKNEKIKVYLNEKNLGQFPNRNLAASYAKGKYIKYLDSDDIIYPHGLETMVNAMEQFPEAGIGFSFNNYEEKTKLPILFTPNEAFKYHFFYKGLLYIGPTGSIYNRKYFNEIGLFQDYKVASDYELNLRATINKPVVLFNRDLIWWRQHEEQEINSRNNEYLILNYIINKKSLKNCNLETKIKKKIILNNEILMARRLLLLLLKFKIKIVIQTIKEIKFPLKYFLRCFLPAKK